MTDKKLYLDKYLDLILMILISFGLSFAYFFEYYDNIIPCKLCYITRYCYFSILFTIFLKILLKRCCQCKLIQKLIKKLIILMLFGVVIFSGYQIFVGNNSISHFCVNPKIIEEIYIDVNNKSSNKSDNIKQFQEKINKIIDTPCNVEYKKFGIPLTWLNFLYIIFVTLIYIFAYQIHSKLCNFLYKKN